MNADPLARNELVRNEARDPVNSNAEPLLKAAGVTGDEALTEELTKVWRQSRRDQAEFILFVEIGARELPGCVSFQPGQ